ncbi:MAG TPA: ISAs1 family transposase [Microcoleus sp.]|nr:ISAs1 family transposase [Microcoleus sp.]
MLTLITFLKKVNDPRHNSGKRHPLWLILLLVILGMMFGHLGYRDIAAFAKAHQKIIVKFFKVPEDRLPSYSTIRRAMMLLDTSNFIEIFNQWARSLTPGNSGSDWVSIDGKCLKSTCVNHDKNSQNFVSMVSLFSQTSGLVLGLQKIENKKTSEIKCVQELVKTEKTSNRVFTLDALHCQKQTTTLITQSKNDYTIALKGNQKKLLKAALKLSENHQALTDNQTVDISHGRQIVRKVSVFNIESLNSHEFNSEDWGQMRSLVKVERSGTRGQKDYEHLAYYISSLSADAETFASKIRGHWLIENQLHWVKDVIFQEDRWPRHDYKAVTNLSILSTIALNLYRLLGFFSVKAGQRWLGSSLSKLTLIFS